MIWSSDESINLGGVYDVAQAKQSPLKNFWSFSELAVQQAAAKQALTAYHNQVVSQNQALAQLQEAFTSGAAQFYPVYYPVFVNPEDLYPQYNPAVQFPPTVA